MVQDKSTFVLRGARVIDPTQSIDRIEDVIVADGKVSAIGGPVPADAKVLDLISRKYMDLSNDKDINYLKFCHDADDVKEMTEALAKEPPKEFHYHS